MAKATTFSIVTIPLDTYFERGEAPILIPDKGERLSRPSIAGNWVQLHSGTRRKTSLKRSQNKWARSGTLSQMFKIPGPGSAGQTLCDEPALPWAETSFSFQNQVTESLSFANERRRGYYNTGEVARNSVDIIALAVLFHGRSFAAINAAGNPKYLEGLGRACRAL